MRSHKTDQRRMRRSGTNGSPAFTVIVIKLQASPAAVQELSVAVTNGERPRLRTAGKRLVDSCARWHVSLPQAD
jgi:hypothetical protein